MKHYKDPATNEIYAYEVDGSQDDIIPAHFLSLTDDEVSEIRLQLNQAIEEAKTYRERRVAEYPPIGDQLDALFHVGVFPAEMAAQIQAVKDKYPKV